MKSITLVPAYGRDYKNKLSVACDFNQNKDFIIQDISCQWDGKPANKQDLINGGYDFIKIRYDKLRKVFILNRNK